MSAKFGLGREGREGGDGRGRGGEGRGGEGRGGEGARVPSEVANQTANIT